MAHLVPDRITVRLQSIGRGLHSRIDAQAVLDRQERHKEVVLDFSGIDAVGEEFLVEIFRTWVSLHPSVGLTPKNMSATVRLAVERALRGAVIRRSSI